jgi:hypothetical protein
MDLRMFDVHHIDPFDVTRRRMQLAQVTPDKHHWGYAIYLILIVLRI